VPGRPGNLWSTEGVVVFMTCSGGRARGAAMLRLRRVTPAVMSV
jgi:hypothetical protein